jgi:hypothetical protein
VPTRESGRYRWWQNWWQIELEDWQRRIGLDYYDRQGRGVAVKADRLRGRSKLGETEIELLDSEVPVPLNAAHL